MKRVLITGRGVASPFGNNLAALMDGLEESRSAVARMAGWEEFRGLHSLVGAPAEWVDDKVFPRRIRRTMGRLGVFAALAATQAADDAGLDAGLLTSRRLGCIMGSTMGSAEAMNEAFEIMLPEHDLSQLSPMSFFKSVSHTGAMNVAQALGLKGYVMATAAACASSLQAIGLGYELIRGGRQDVLLCGGAEELHPIVTGVFDILFATSTHFNDDVQMTPRPFDSRRDGLVCGEGAGVLVLEDYEHACNRGADVYGEVVGYSTNASGSHVSQSSREGMRACMADAIQDSGLEPAQVDYISAHATATLQGDQAEAEAIHDVFGGGVPVSGLKGYIGHTLGASGAIELAACLEMMSRGIIYPTLNLTEVDAACDGIAHVQRPLAKEISVVVKNSFAFGGINASLVCKKPEGH